MSFETYIKGFKKYWALLLQFATVISTTVSGIITPPDSVERLNMTGQVKAFAVLIIAVVVGVFFFFASKWRFKKNARSWLITTIIFLALTIGSFFYYQSLKISRMCFYAGELVAIGNVYTPKGEDYTAKNSDISCETLLFDFAGKADNIWTAESINSSRLLLMEVYVFAVILLSICIMSVIQLISCLSKGKN